MLPEDPVVLLVDADGVGGRGRVALLVGHDGVEVVDLAEAVAAERQRVRHAPEPPLACIEGVLPPVDRSRVAVGDHHLADRRPVEDRPHAAAVLVADGVEHQTLERVERNSQRPALPAQHVALEREAHAVGLHDLQRSQVVPQRAVVLRVVAAGLDGQGRGGEVEHLQHLTAGHVDECLQPLDRPGVAVRAGLLPVEADAAHDPPPVLGGDPEAARRPGIDLDPVEVGEAPRGERSLEPLVLVEGDDGVERLVETEGRTHVVVLHPGEDLARVDRDDGLDQGALGPRHDHEACRAVRRGRARPWVARRA